MAPEQLKGEPIDRRTDVFAAGVVLHELLTGQKLFTGDSVYAVALAIDRQEISAPSQHAPAVPPELDAVVLQALQKEPAQRFASAHDMADALEQLLARAGGETLEQYASRALSAERAEHESWLRQVLEEGGADGVQRRGRGEDVATAPRGGVQLGASLVSPAQDTLDPTTPQRSLARRAPANLKFAEELLTTTPAGLATASRPGRRGLLWGMGFAGLVGLLGLGYWLAQAPTAALVASDAGSSDVGPIEVEHAAAVAPGSASSQPLPTAAPATAPVLDAGVGSTTQPSAGKPVKARPVRHKNGRSPRRRTDSSRPLAPVSAAAQTFGYLSVAAEPYALVRIDGVQIGATPIYNHKLAIGPHTLTLVSPDTGETRHQEQVNLAEGERRRVVVK